MTPKTNGHPFISAPNNGLRCLRLVLTGLLSGVGVLTGEARAAWLEEEIWSSFRATGPGE